MITESDLAYLHEAVALAERGLFTTTPNPRVGCVIVRDGLVLGRGWHRWPGQAHAEINALRDAGGDVAGATVYVSLEPCTVYGRTPPCVDALVAAGVKRVVAGASDPDSRVNGRGFERLGAAGIECEAANLPAALNLNAGHRLRFVEGRPLIRIKMAASLDGRTAMASGESQWITGAAARQDAQYWRARSCAIVTGIGTVLADDPRLNVRDGAYALDGRLRAPLRVVADSGMRTPAGSRLFAEDGAVLIAHAGSAGLAHPHAQCLKCGDGRVNLRGLMAVLAERGCNEVLVEAGPTLAGALIGEELWDEMILYLAPRLLGAAARPLIDRDIEWLADAVSGRFDDCVPVGEDLRLHLVRGE